MVVLWPNVVLSVRDGLFALMAEVDRLKHSAGSLNHSSSVYILW